MKISINIPTLVLLILAYPAAFMAQTPAATDQGSVILEEFKKILSVDKEYRINCQMATYAPEQKPVFKSYTVYAKSGKSLLVFAQPERDAGKMILLIEDNLWQYFPKLQKTIVINASMNLSGGVNLSDIISASLFQMYSYTNYEFVKEKNIHILTFHALTKNSPYGRVKYFYSDGRIDYFEAYSRSGILLKKVVFVKYAKDSEGQNIPVQIKIINALQDNDYSLIQMSGYQDMKVPDYFFNPSALDKVSVQQ